MRTDKHKIKLMVDELLSNAIDAHADDINISVRKSNDDIIITVEDDGIGMDEEDLRRTRKLLNQPFRKDLEEYFGQLTGLDNSTSGLNLIGMQSERAEIESTKGKGTKITIYNKHNH